VTAGLIAVLKIVGMAVGTVLFLVALLRFVERMRWRSTLAIAVGTAAVNYLIFTYWLRVPFPVGVLGF
jgi:putative tricarboxylic transport membrane protein